MCFMTRCGRRATTRPHDAQPASPQGVPPVRRGLLPLPRPDVRHPSWWQDTGPMWGVQRGQPVAGGRRQALGQARHLRELPPACPQAPDSIPRAQQARGPHPGEGTASPWGQVGGRALHKDGTIFARGAPEGRTAGGGGRSHPPQRRPRREGVAGQRRDPTSRRARPRSCSPPGETAWRHCTSWPSTQGSSGANSSAASSKAYCYARPHML